MAKKAAEIEGYSKDQGGPGWKRCPSCNGFVKGPLTKVCPACQHEFQFKSKLVRKSASTQGSTSEILVMEFALKMGGTDKALAAIKKLAGDPAIVFAIQLGGIGAAETALNRLAEKLSGKAN